MKITLTLTSIFLISSVVLCQYTKKDFKRLERLSGMWKRDVNVGMNHEYWKKVSEIELAGSSYHIDGKDTILQETISMTLISGKIYYAVKAFGQNDNETIVFTLSTIDKNRYTFTNPDHDFPNKIIYHFKDKYQLHARIEGTINESVKTIDFYFKKLK